MGWTSYHATHYKNNTVDRKAECDAYFTEGLNKGYYNIVASSVIGSTYYAAIQLLKECRLIDGKEVTIDIPKEERETTAVVILTWVNTKDYFNFGYKIIGETSGPYRYNCPLKVLNSLSPTTNEWANEWREKCRENIIKNNMKNSRLKKLPIGSKIKFIFQGKEVVVEKKSPMYQFKHPWYKVCGEDCYIKQKSIPENFKIVN